MKINSFEDLEIRVSAVNLTAIIYKITNQNKFEKDFGLRDQIRRSTISISSNIAEVFERSNNIEFIRFLKIAKWSCWEARTQLQIAYNIWYIWEEEFQNIKNKFFELSNKLGWFIQYLNKHKIAWNFKNK